MKILLIVILSILGGISILVTVGCSMITQPNVNAVNSSPPEVSPERLEEHVRFFSETVHPRNYLELENLNAAADYIAAYFKALNFEVSEQVYDVNGQQYRNIIASTGAKEGDVLIVGAHYDSFQHTPGADDNASGVAGLLELARLLSEYPPTQAVELIAYTLEEPPFFATDDMGSAVHARSVRDAGRDVKLMISLEMIGYFNDEIGSQTFPLSFLNFFYPKQGDFIGIIGRFADSKETRKVKALMMGATNLPVYSLNAPRFLRVIDFSDHRNYWDEGISAVMITNTAFFRNKSYHQLTDTAATLDYERMAKVVQGVFAVMHHYE